MTDDWRQMEFNLPETAPYRVNEPVVVTDLYATPPVADLQTVVDVQLQESPLLGRTYLVATRSAEGRETRHQALADGASNSVGKLNDDIDDFWARTDRAARVAVSLTANWRQQLRELKVGRPDEAVYQSFRERGKGLAKDVDALKGDTLS